MPIPSSGQPPIRPEEIEHFLVSYDLTTGETKVKPFGTDYDAALEAYAETEQVNGFGFDAKLDIVLLGADSLETIERTHSSYFSGAHRSLEELLGV